MPTRYQPVPKRCGVDLDETGTVDKDFGSHVTHCDQLGSVFQTSVVLFQNLHKNEHHNGFSVFTTSLSHMAQEIKHSGTNSYLEQVGALPWTQTTNILDQALCVRMGDGPVYIHSNLIDTIDEFTVESREQVFLYHMFLVRKRRKNVH